ncbi:MULTISPECIES: 16S rRNA (guanine(527)-N(7))-methyltransferase RsmG [unclassified Prochlorococcus]|uniref:16S rRNA (guanine(527)-N(7))-methyltransferase RsmG n=1 Tax=unclassified Prochlorococcus TaxID=2627481 RepID=UPI0005337C59|nr:MULTISPECIES: 16S rRNA (guanine(527)-N(7))-methyltransferase RsmG [unclassified Prochlorococcus]KGG14764.1 rRNA small subunit 7-methylguanosine (m7G) methyltransferase GidB [Prochlorococcus sp. MIT 0602]KGG15805.1 rRNA small subunit 7-methylguanosine (m7G) methyltransferase GidB [Prochlorococcus sp. MIT 0603]
MLKQTEFKKLENEIWAHLGWQPSKQQLEQLSKLQLLLKKWNKQVNLTRLIEGNDFWVCQILDSLWPIKEMLLRQEEAVKIIDVGTGCGLPGLALAIALKNSSVTLVDSILKKTNAIETIVKELGLIDRVNIRTERIEVTGQNLTFRSSFDLALARAVAKGPVLAEYLIPLLNQSGQGIIYKGKWGNNEQFELKAALSKLHGEMQEVKSFELPQDKGIRHVIFLRCKNKCPPEYPRAIGIPTKKPLNN